MSVADVDHLVIIQVELDGTTEGIADVPASPPRRVLANNRAAGIVECVPRLVEAQHVVGRGQAHPIGRKEAQLQMKVVDVLPAEQVLGVEVVVAGRE